MLNDNHILVDITFKSNTLLSFYEMGQVQAGILNTNQTINNISYTNTNISFYPNGQVSNGTLFTNQMIDAANWTGGESISFFEGGQIKEGHLQDSRAFSNSHYGINISYHEEITFYPNGQVNRGTFSGALDAVYTINGIEYFTFIEFYESGKIMVSSLSKEAEIDGVNYGGIFGVSPIHYYENEQVKQCQLSGNQNIAGTNYFHGHWIRWTMNGIVHSSSANFVSNFNP